MLLGHASAERADDRRGDDRYAVLDAEAAEIGQREVPVVAVKGFDAIPLETISEVYRTVITKGVKHYSRSTD